MITVGMTLGEKVDNAMTYLNAMAQRCPSAANIARYADSVRATARCAAPCCWGGVSDMAMPPRDGAVLQVREWRREISPRWRKPYRRNSRAPS